MIVASSRDLVWCEGPDAASYLQGQVSQEVEGLAVGESRPTLVLQPQGRVEVFGRLTRTGDDRFLIDVEPGHGEATLARLQRFKIRVDAELRLEPGVAVVSVRDSTAPEGADLSLAATWPAHDGVDLVGPPDGLVAVDTTEDLEAARIEAGVPRMGAELDDATIPAEAGAWMIDASVSFTKGCYVGQELVARVDSRGSNTPRRLRRFRFEGDAPAVGSPVVIDGSVVGALTSAAHGVALGYVGRGAVDATTATVGEGDEARPASIEAL